MHERVNMIRVSELLGHQLYRLDRLFQTSPQNFDACVHVTRTVEFHKVLPDESETLPTIISPFVTSIFPRLVPPIRRVQIFPKRPDLREFSNTINDQRFPLFATVSPRNRISRTCLDTRKARAKHRENRLFKIERKQKSGSWFAGHLSSSHDLRKPPWFLSDNGALWDHKFVTRLTTIPMDPRGSCGFFEHVVSIDIQDKEFSKIARPNRYLHVTAKVPWKIGRIRSADSCTQA